MSGFSQHSALITQHSSLRTHRSSQHWSTARPVLTYVLVKRDLLLVLIAIVVIGALCFGLASMRPSLAPTPSHPFSVTTGETPAVKGSETVIMRVNGEPVTEREFDVFTASLPQQAQLILQNPNARRVLAEQYVKMKVLEQEARKLGSESDPDVAAKMRFGKTNVADEYAVRKLASQPPSDQMLQQEYEKSKGEFAVVDLSHIAVGYQGSKIPSRSQPAPTPEVAAKMASEMAARVRSGEPFEKIAGMFSDDQSSAQVGGRLGLVPVAQLPPEIQRAIANLAPGQMSGPVVSQFAVHIFRVNARRTQSFAEVKPMLQQRMAQTVVENAIDNLAKSAKVEYDDKFFPPATAKGKTPRS